MMPSATLPRFSAAWSLMFDGDFRAFFFPLAFQVSVQKQALGLAFHIRRPEFHSLLWHLTSFLLLQALRGQTMSQVNGL